MHILIVDDDQSLRRALGRAIELAGYATEHGHRVSTARDGDECRRFVAVDVILMDGDLESRENGPQVVAAMRQALAVNPTIAGTEPEQLPSWL